MTSVIFKSAVALFCVGFLFLTFAGQASALTYTGYSSASDGYVRGGINTYADAHNGTSGTVFSTDTSANIGQRDVVGDGSAFYGYRAFVYFDTSSIPSNATITSATLSLYGKTDVSTTDFNITIQNGQPTYPHDPLVTGDYLYTQYSGDGGTLSTSGFSTSGYNDITLNATGLTWIQKAGSTKLALLSSRDISATAPSGSEYLAVWSNEKGAGFQPKLVVNYTLPNTAPTGTFNSATQATDGTGNVNASITVSDADANNAKAKIEYTTDSGCATGTTKATLTGTPTASVTPAPDLTQGNDYQLGTTTPILTTSSNTITFVWDSITDLPSATGGTNYYLCLTANDGTVDQTSIGASSAMAVDNTAPTVTITNPNTTPAQTKTITASTDSGTLTMSNTTGAICNGTLTFSTYASQIFTSESDNTIKVCYKAVDAVGNITYSLSSAISGITTTGPTLSETTSVSTPAGDTTPSYTFNSTEAGTIQYTGDCSSSTTTAVLGANTITFTALSRGVHSNCTIKVTDALNNQSSALSVSPFTILALGGGGIGYLLFLPTTQPTPTPVPTPAPQSTMTPEQRASAIAQIKQQLISLITQVIQLLYLQISQMAR